MTQEVLKLALETLENSVDLVVEDAYNAEQLYGNYPTRQGKVGGLKVLAEQHKQAITAIKEAMREHAMREVQRLGQEIEQEPVTTLEDLEQEIYENTRQFVSRDVMEWMLKRYYTTPQQQEPVATDWERIARVQNAKLMAMCNEAGGFEKLCEVMDKYEKTTPPQRTWVGLTDEDKAILDAVHRELDRDCDEGNAPGHSHRTKGVWDEDNGKLAGKPCAWCLTWNKFTTLIKNEAAHGITGEKK